MTKAVFLIRKLHILSKTWKVIPEVPHLYSMALPVVEFSRQGYKIGKVFPLKSTVVKWNYWIFRIWLMGSLSSLQKSEFSKVDYFILPLCLVPKLKPVAQNEWKKHPYIFFSTFGSKINKFERKKIRKKQKNSKNLKVAGNYPNI